MHGSHNSSEIVAREKGATRKKDAAEAWKPAETRIERQQRQDESANFAEIPTECDWGCKRNSKGAKESATVNFMRNFRALSKSVEFHPSPGHDRYAAFFLRPTLAFCFVDSGSGIGVKPGSRAILFSSDSSLRMVGTIAHLCGSPASCGSSRRGLRST